MSEKENRKLTAADYQTMTTGELEELLRLDMEGPAGADTDSVLLILEELENRKKAEQTGNSAQKAWESFQRDYLPEIEEQSEQKKSVPWWRPLAAAAAVLVLLVGLTATVDAFGWVDVWGAVAKWAKETFSFVGTGQTQPTEPTPKDTTRYETFHQAIVECTDQTALVPKIVPAGFTLDRVELQVEDERDVYLAVYINEDRFFRVQVQSYGAEALEWVEKSAEAVEIYEADNTSYYIFSNNSRLTAAWAKDSYECYISGELTIEEIKLMIDSIGKG